jgi:nucleoid DNA-binding protein
VKALKLSKLIHEVWEDERTRELRLRKDEVKILVNVMIDHIVKGLLKHGEVKLRGLFTLDVREIKGRKIRNPQTKEEMYIDDYYKVGIKEPSKRLKEGLENYQK